MRIRLASSQDADALIEFNRAMALETEAKELLPEVISAGVHSMLANPSGGFYVVAEIDGRVVGALMVTKEWSDWRNGSFWWVQSVYVPREFRRRGIYRSLYQHIKELAAQDATVCGFRLYVERENERAQATYLGLGMTETRYRVFEELKPGVRFFRSREKGSERIS